MTDIELAWAAGLFEGEGSIRITKPQPRNWGSVWVCVTNTDPQVVEWFNVRWPGYYKRATGLRPDQRPAWVWVTAARKATGFLEQIRPYVVRDRVKQRIDHAIRFQADKRNRNSLTSEEDRWMYAAEQWAAYWWSRELNARGIQAAAR